MGINKNNSFRFFLGLIVLLFVLCIILAYFFGGAKLGRVIYEGIAERIRNTFSF